MKKYSCLTKIGLLFLFLIISGCSFRYTPKLYPIKPGAVPDFRSRATVDVVNPVQDSEVIHLGTVGSGIHHGSLGEIGDAIIVVMKNEAVKKGVNFESGAKKKMSVTVLETNVYKKPFAAVWCKIVAKVETGSGYSEMLQVENASGLPDRACDGAITIMATSILNDEEVIEYLSK